MPARDILRATRGALRRAALRVLGLRHMFPLTPLGVTVGLLGYWLAFRYGPEHVDRVLHAAGLVSLAVLGLSLVSVLGASLGVWLAARRAPSPEAIHLETGSTASTGLRLPGLGLWPLVQLRVQWDEPGDVEATLARGLRRREEMIRPMRRGLSRRVVRRLLVSDVFGFSGLGPTLRAATSVRVVPARARLTAHVLSRFLGGDQLPHPEGRPEGEMIEMRRYVRGDPLRHVLWKAFARTRKLLVRVPETSINPRPSAAAYLVSGPGDEPSASVARFFLEGGLLGEGFLFAADGNPEPTGDVREAVEKIVLGAACEGGTGLEWFIDRLEHGRRRNCLLFVPPVPGPWLDLVERAAPRLNGARVVCALDDRPSTARRGLLVRLLLADREDGERARRGLHEVVSRLAARGYDVSVVHRPSGDLLSRAQLEGLARSVA